MFEPGRHGLEFRLRSRSRSRRRRNRGTMRRRRRRRLEEEGVCAHLRPTFVLDLSCLLLHSLAVQGPYSGARSFRKY